MEMMTQRVEFLAAPRSVEIRRATMIITIRPDPATSFRPHNLALAAPRRFGC